MGLGASEYAHFSRFARDFMGIDHEGIFYYRMDSLDKSWTLEAQACADCLRLYADKYHPAESRALIPASVMRIFDMPLHELAREMSNV